MWQRRALQTELGTADAMVQLSFAALKRFTAAQPISGAATVAITESANDGIARRLPPGVDWSLSSRTRTVTANGLVLSGLDMDTMGNPRARCAVSLSGTDMTKTSYGKVLYGGISGRSPLGEL